MALNGILAGLVGVTVALTPPSSGLQLSVLALVLSYTSAFSSLIIFVSMTQLVLFLCTWCAVFEVPFSPVLLTAAGLLGSSALLPAVVGFGFVLSVLLLLRPSSAGVSVKKRGRRPRHR